MEYGTFEFDITMRAMRYIKYIQNYNHNPTPEMIRLKILDGKIQKNLKELEKYNGKRHRLKEMIRNNSKNK